MANDGGAGRRVALAAALVRSCHPIPTVAVTAIGAALGALAGNDAAHGALIAAAILAGQLSIGWSNDVIDADRDHQSRRQDNPGAEGAVARGTVAQAAAIALLVAIALAAVLGPRAGGASLVIVVAGWVYNGGLKATLWSWVPYAVAFGALPGVATLALPAHPFPAAWAVLAGALLGVAAHLANAAPDLADDVAGGVRGLPHRLGRRATAVLGPVLLAAAAVVVFIGSGASTTWWRIVAFTVCLGAAAVAAVVAAQQAPGRRYFLATLIAVGLDVVLFGLSGHRLS